MLFHVPSLGFLILYETDHVWNWQQLHDHQWWSKSVIGSWPENQDVLKWKCTTATFMTDNWTQATPHRHLRLLTLARLATEQSLEQSLTPLYFFLSPGSRTACSLKCKRMTDMLSGSTCLTELLKSQARTCVYLSLLAFFRGALSDL